MAGDAVTTWAGEVREEWRLIRVQGSERKVCARGSRAYVEPEFTDFAAHPIAVD